MATIVFILYPEAGHLFPTFKLARSLKRRGHRVHYFGPVDFEADIRAQGFDFIPILEQICPRGFIRERAQVKRIDNFDAILLEMGGDGRKSGLGPVEEVIAKVNEIAPDLLIVDVLLPDLALILCRQRAPVVFLNIILFTPWEEGPDSYKPLLNLPELVLCPAAFEFPQVVKSGRRHYLGASIDLEREETPFQWDRIDGDKPIFYVSLGSQSHLSPYSRRFFQGVIDVMNNRNDLQAIISIGSQLSVEDFHHVNQNITLVNDAPQIKILQKASVMITHGGLGSVKECIFFGVPMIVFPLTREQPINAARVVYHGLGVRGDVQNASARQMASLIKRVEGNAAIKARIEIMSKKFREAEDSCDGGEIIDAILSQMA